MKDKIKRIETLELLILKYQKSYYNGEAEIPDAEFDLLWDELKTLAPESRVIKKIGTGSDELPFDFSEPEGNLAPGARRGIPEGNLALRARREMPDTPKETEYGVDGFPKAKHLIPMGSQEKAANPMEFIEWARKMGMETDETVLQGGKSKKFIVQYKLDGASLELQYEKGSLMRAITRGDGITGDEITSNARRMANVVTKLDIPFTGGIRGEVMMTRDVWRNKYSAKANCRNAANGIMRRKDGQGCEDLVFISYDAAANEDDAYFIDEMKKINWLSKRGFETTPAKIFDNAQDIVTYRQEVSASRETLPYDIDGLVVKDIETDMADLRRARPEKQIAFKFELEIAFSILRQVIWSESGATYTPIGVIDPVRLAGTTVQRANLNNPDMIRSLGFKIGSVVSVVKRGEIIPKIEGLAPDGALENAPEQTSEIEFPANCSVCNTELVDAGTRLYCPNNACPKRLLHRLEKWVSVLDIRELGEKLLGQLFTSGRVQHIQDLYTLETAELAEYERMGELSAAKVLRHINTPRELSLAKFIAAFDFEGIAETTMEKVTAAGFDTLEKLRNAALEELSDIYGLGEITAKVIMDGMKEASEEMDAVLTAGPISISLPPATESQPLKGLSFCFTGELTSMKRSEAEEKIKSLGAMAKTTIVKGLSYLVTNDPSSGSAKNKKARELGIPIINEGSFLEMIHQ